jgi:hypothetical protein
VAAEAFGRRFTTSITGADGEDITEGAELFWDIADELMIEDPRVVEGRIMSSRCLRVEDEFLALCDRRREGLVVKLPKPRVQELIAKGVGEPFAPAGRTFKEWGLIP